MSRKVAILGVPMDLGQGRRGVDMGPSAIRYGRLDERLAAIGCEVTDLGDVDVPAPRSWGRACATGRRHGLSRGHPRRLRGDDREARWRSPARPSRSSSAATTRSPWARSPARSRRERTGVIWVDAHGDFNTPETSPSGNIHGMPLGALCGVGDRRLIDLGWPGAKVRPEDVVLIGVRDLDGEERRADARRRRHRLHHEGGRPCSACRGSPRRRWRGSGGLPRLHVSFDADVLDPEVAPGVGTPVPGGFTYREAHLLMELFADAGQVDQPRPRRGEPDPRPREPHRQHDGRARGQPAGQADLLARFRRLAGRRLRRLAW